MSSKVKFISRARKKKLLDQLSRVEEGTPEAKAIREQLGAHAPLDPIEEAKKKKAIEDARKKLEEENRKAIEAAKAQRIKEMEALAAEAEKQRKAQAAAKKKAEAAKKRREAAAKKKAAEKKTSK